MNRIARALIKLMLRRVASGKLVVLEANRARRYGREGPEALVTVHSPGAWKLLLRGSLGLADGYAERLWDSPDLVAVVRLAARNAHRLDRLRAWVAPMARPWRAIRVSVRPPTRRRSRRDIAAHYDLGQELFTRMLDPTLTYSCALFERSGMTLEEAQLAKLELVCEQLELGPADRVLEIGTGWGSFALHAAATRGCHVTTTTISADQYAYAAERVSQAGIGDRVTVLDADYRDLRGRYDKLVSIEMIEAVGWRQTGTFLGTCSRLLEPHGAMLLQAIVIDDRAYEIEKGSSSFIKQRIFPGGSLPSIAALSRDLARQTDLQLAGLRDLTVHYVTTLRRWREKFIAHAEELEKLGYDQAFQRFWTLYLAYCEAGFAERRIRDAQLLLTKPGCRLRSVRDAASETHRPTIPV
ncbi:MAG TPA: cyclopropane-fatty-acyl-phospholipid synthase family protein [Solirubrobacteraceae bacterium]|nr:cyclopropane-fatty-acyl-phospholipid synthase family protein [Solirubrobacteraceae bacterium]